MKKAQASIGIQRRPARRGAEGIKVGIYLSRQEKAAAQAAALAKNMSFTAWVAQAIEEKLRREEGGR